MAVIEYPDPRLRTKVEYDNDLEDDEVVCDLLKAAIEEDRKHQATILGIAANQIGIMTRIILYRGDDGYLKGLIDPVITVASERDWIEPEGCGSLPGYECDVARSKTIHVTSKEVERDFDGWEARIIQHEIDHLDGILILDREVGYEREDC